MTSGTGSGLVSRNKEGTQIVLARFPVEGETLTSFGLTPSVIKTIAIPNDIQEWPLTALNGCTALEKLTVYGEEVDEGTITLSWEHNLRNLGNLKIFHFPSSIEKTMGKKEGELTVLPGNIDSVYFSKNIKILGDYSFIRCKFTNIVFPKGIALTELCYASIDQNPNLITADFSGCTCLHTIRSTVLILHPSLITIILPRSIRTITAWALRACPKLTTVIWMGEKTSDIGENCFTDCPLLQNEIILHETA